ncbi:g5313 [Coccomyxa viridis]|uniref:G5313 protein n=1 Tax=Coccomyxa viridis TaxID=1274662 RepID=A0ABP1FWG3_9CHLO
MQVHVVPSASSVRHCPGCSVGLPRHRQAFTVRTQRQQRRCNTQIRAEDGSKDDSAFDDRLAALKKAKKQAAYGSSRKEKDKDGGLKQDSRMSKYDFSREQIHWEGPPHRGDIAVNLALGTTLLWLPLTIASVTRGAFVNFIFSDKRLSVITTAPWKTERLDAAYQEIKDVKTVGRGIGLWGDMVVTLRNNDKIELRSLPKFLELKEYILKRREELSDTKNSSEPKSVTSKGFS